MSIGSEAKRRLRMSMAPAIFLGITGYFGWNAMQGDHGLKASAQRKALLQQVIQDRDAANTEHQAWEKRVAGLRTAHLDPDTLNERVRAKLNAAEPSEVIVKLGPKEKLF